MDRLLLVKYMTSLKMPMACTVQPFFFHRWFLLKEYSTDEYRYNDGSGAHGSMAESVEDKITQTRANDWQLHR